MKFEQKVPSNKEYEAYPSITSDILVQLQFKNLAEAHFWYLDYVDKVGFRIMRRDCLKLKSSQIMSYIWVCTNEGL